MTNPKTLNKEKEAFDALPEYNSPPVIEVVCGVHFKLLEKLLIPHFGLLWEKLKSKYSECQEHEILLPAIERFDEVSPSEILIRAGLPLPRVWFLEKNGNGIVQVQRDRFIYNWRKLKPEDAYPRYHTVINTFRNHFMDFQAFISDMQIGAITPLQYELIYINHIPEGAGWENLRDIGGVFPDFMWRVSGREFLPEPEGINWQTSFRLPDESGRLHVTIRNGTQRDTKQQVLLLDLTARGMGSHTSPEAIWQWFDLAHEWIVCGFSDLTSEEIQNKIWRRKR